MIGNCHEKITTDVLIGELSAGPLLRVDMRRERVDLDEEHMDLSRFSPLDRVKTYFLPFLYYMVEISITRVLSRYLCLERFYLFPVPLDVPRARLI